MKASTHTLYIYRLCFCAAVLSLLMSCGVHKKRTTVPESLPSKAEIQEQIANYPMPPSYDAQGTLSIETPEKSVASAYRMSVSKEGYVYLSVRPLGLLEAVRLLASPERLLLIDRLKKRAVSLEQPELGQATEQLLQGWRPEILQAMLLAVPVDLQGRLRPELKGFEMRVQPENGFVLEQQAAGKRLLLHFSRRCKLLGISCYQGQKLLLECLYDGGRSWETELEAFPELLAFRSVLSSKEHRLRLEINRQSVPARQQSYQATVPSHYKQFSLQQVLKLIEEL